MSVISKKATFIGQTQASATTSELSYSKTLNYGISTTSPIIFKIQLPSFTGISSFLQVKLRTNRNANVKYPARFSLCTSDSNFVLYTKSKNLEVSDAYQIKTGTVYVSDENYTTFNIKTNKLKSEEVYYLFLWFPQEIVTNGGGTVYVSHQFYINYTGAIYINQNQKNQSYQCYINTKYLQFATDNCEIIGQTNLTTNSATGALSLGTYNLTSTVKMGVGYSSPSYNYYPCYLKFKTPTTFTKFDDIVFYIKLTGTNYKTIELIRTMRYALCTSDSNYSSYANIYNAVSDKNQIATGTFNTNTANGSTITIKISSVSLNPGTEYYLIIWPYDQYEPVVTVSKASLHKIVVVNRETENASYKTEPLLYTPYIDNGTSWDPL